MIPLQNLPQAITAIGGLGTAAFGLVDAFKVFGGGVNHIGFKGIREAVTPLTPESGAAANTLSHEKIVATLEANWFNGTDLTSQKAIAKSLIKLNLNSGNAAELADATGVDPAAFKAIAASLASGTPLSSTAADVYARFDLIVTALLDEAYQRADQAYRNGTRAWAMVAAIVLAVIAGLMLHPSGSTFYDIGESVFVGLLATPLAPIAKDISSALASAVNTLQAVKK